VNDRRTQAAMLLVVGVTALWLGLSDATLAYVRSMLRPPLAVSGLVLLALGLITLRQSPRADQEEGEGCGDAHGGHSLRSAWLLLVPVLVLVLVAPPALGSFAASRQSSKVAGESTSDFPPLPAPVDGAVPMPMSEFVSRAFYDRGQSLAGVRVRLLGFVTPLDEIDGDYLLYRFNFFCCAADNDVYGVVVRGDAVPRRADQWLVVEGRWVVQPPLKALVPTLRHPVLVVSSVTPVAPPTDRYEHNLYAF
jgi:uncharacterized repeat protein (TIGR03943 family)